VSDPALAGLTAPLAAVGEESWAVGGAVRDALLGRPVADVDVAVAGDAAAAAARLARAGDGATRFRLSSDFGSWRVQGGALPFSVDLTPLQGGSLAEDLSRRDLTVNAMAAPVPAGPLVDPHGGREDLAAGRLRLVRDDALAADPVRLLRLPRLAVQLGFEVAPETAARAAADAGGIWSGPGERLRDELGRILRLGEAWRAFALMDDLGVLGALVPELAEARGLEQSPYHDRDVLGHTLQVVQFADELVADPAPVFRADADAVRAELAEPLADDLTRGQALVLGALLHDMAKPATRGVTPEGRITFMRHDTVGAEMADDLCRRLRTSGRLREFTTHLVRHHLPLGFAVHRAPLSLRQIHRYLRHTAPYAGEVIVLSAADRLATAGPRTTRAQIDRHLALAREVMRVHLAERGRGPVRPPLAGDELAAALGREPGPWLGEVMRELEEEVAVGAVRDREGAIRFARRYLAGDVPERAVPGVWRAPSGAARRRS
jgi:putative nucleotidyltransferase with HDIG domain